MSAKECTPEDSPEQGRKSRHAALPEMAGCPLMLDSHGHCLLMCRVYKNFSPTVGMVLLL